MIEKIITVEPRGFCAGVVRSIDTVEKALKKYGAPIYVKHAIVHNQTVIQSLEKKGAIFVENIIDIPPKAVVVFSAHGSPPQHYRQAKKRNLNIIDATCPLVAKVHQEMRHFLQSEYQVIYIGHKGHVETEGVLGEAKNLGKDSAVFIIKNKEEALNLIQSKRISFTKTTAVLSQTTFNVYKIEDIINVLKDYFVKIIRPDVKDICYATTNRQEAVLALAQKVDLVYVIGSMHSSNSNRLKEIAEEQKIPAYIIDNLNDISEKQWKNKRKIGLTAAASAPEFRVQEVVDFFKSKGAIHQEIQGTVEKMHFSLPKF